MTNVLGEWLGRLHHRNGVAAEPPVARAEFNQLAHNLDQLTQNYSGLAKMVRGIETDGMTELSGMVQRMDTLRKQEHNALAKHAADNRDVQALDARLAQLLSDMRSVVSRIETLEVRLAGIERRINRGPMRAKKPIRKRR